MGISHSGKRIQRKYVKNTVGLVLFAGFTWVLWNYYLSIPKHIFFFKVPRSYQQSSVTFVVTASNWRYYKSLKNFIASVQYWESKRPILVYNIGLFRWQLYELSKLCNVFVHWPDGPPAEYPEHVTSPYVYAWKALAIKDAVDKYKKVIWIDAGSDIRGHLDLVDKDLERDGFFFIPGGPVEHLLHMGMYDYMKLNKPEILKEVGFAGCVQGYVKDSCAYHQVLKRLYECCLLEDCISPPGSSLKNHRYDQSALSLLVRASGLNMTSRMHGGYENFLREYYEKDHTVPSKTVIYTARRGSQEYTQYLKTFESSPSDCLGELG